MLRHVGVSLVARVDVHMQLVVQVNVINWDNYSVKAETAFILLPSRERKQAETQFSWCWPG